MLFAGKKEKQENLDSTQESGVSDFDLKAMLESEHYHLYKFLGVNRVFSKGKLELCFRVWAPNVKAVSLLADFNDWSLSTNPMTKIDESGIWELRLPNREEAFNYQFAIRQMNAEIKIINDPFTKETNLSDRYASYYIGDDFEWQDEAWIKQRENSEFTNQALIIKAIDLNILDKEEFENFQSLANHIVNQAQEEHFTHVELSNFFESIIDLSYSNKFNLSKEALLFAPASAYGRSDDFKCFVNFLHQNNIAVVLKLPYFSSEVMSNFGAFKTLQKPIHYNFYLSNIIYWLEEMHIDGFNFGALEQILVKEKNSNQNFLRRANSLIRKRARSVFSIAQEANCFNLMTSQHDSQEKESASLNFDFKLNLAWLRQVLEIVKANDKEKNLENFSSNILSESFLLGVVKGFETKGLTENDLKLMLALSFFLPSKKYFQEAMLEEIFSKYQSAKKFFQDLASLYRNEAVLNKTDLVAERFCISQIEKNILVFQRWNYDFTEIIIGVVNFASTAKQSFQVDVPKPGFYREIFNSSSYSKQSSLSNDDGVYTYSNNKSLSNKSIVVDIAAKTVLCYKFCLA